MSDRSMSFSPSRSPSPRPAAPAHEEGRRSERREDDDRAEGKRRVVDGDRRDTAARTSSPPARREQLKRKDRESSFSSGDSRDEEYEDKRREAIRRRRQRSDSSDRSGSDESGDDRDRRSPPPFRRIERRRDRSPSARSPPRKTARRSLTPPDRRSGKQSTALIERNPPNENGSRRQAVSYEEDRPRPVGGGGGGGSSALAKLEESMLARKEKTGEGLRLTLAELNATTKAGGAYIPPARLRALMAEAAAADPGSKEFQRMSWDALKKSITGLVNKVAVENIKNVVPELFGGANLVRGRGLYCRAIMKAQSLSLPYTPVFAALTAVINTKLPQIGELLLTRLVSQFRRSFKRNDKTVCNATLIFLAHLVNQRVATEVLALEILVLLLERPTDDSVELAVAFMREVGQFLGEESPKATNSIFERFRTVLYEGDITKRVQFMIEVLSQVRREKFKDNPRIPEGLDLVEEEDQITHEIGLDDQLNVQESLNIFKIDPNFVENEERYRQIKAEILGEGSDSDSEDESGSGSGSDSGSASDDEDGDEEEGAQRRLEIQDATETNLVNLRRTIYLTIMSAAIYEEAVHKLLKLDVPKEHENEMCNMIIECCSQERTYSKFYGHIGERFCKLSRHWSGLFEECFRNYYDTIHRYETNRLRNIARFFGTLLATDSISWASFEIIHMTEEDTTSSSRIFTKILFQEMNEVLGMKALVERFKTPVMQEFFANIFPIDNPKNTRFSINFFTSIGMGALTESMREHLRNVPKMLMAQRQAALANGAGSESSDSDSSSDLSSSTLSSSSRSYSSYDSRYSRRRRSRSYSRSYSPAPRKGGAARGRSRSRSYSSYSRSRSRSRSYDSRDSRAGARRRRERSYSYSSRSRSRSRSYSPPPRRRRGSSYSRSRSRSRSYSRSRSRTRSLSRSRARSPVSPPPLRRRENGRDAFSPDRDGPGSTSAARPPAPPPASARNEGGYDRRRYDDGYDSRRRYDDRDAGGGGGYYNGRREDDRYADARDGRAARPPPPGPPPGPPPRAPPGAHA